MSMSMAFSLSPLSQPHPSPKAAATTHSLIHSFSIHPFRSACIKSPPSFSKLPLTLSVKCSKSEAPPEVERARGVAVYKPKSYQVIADDAANSLFAALSDGKTRLEIDFP